MTKNLIIFITAFILTSLFLSSAEPASAACTYNPNYSTCSMECDIILNQSGCTGCCKWVYPTAVPTATPKPPPPPTSTPVPPPATPTPSCKALSTPCSGNSQCCSGKCAADDASANYYCDTDCGGNYLPCCYPNSCNTGLTCNSVNHYCYIPATPTFTLTPTPPCKALGIQCNGNSQCCSGKCTADDASTNYYCDTECGGNNLPCCYPNSCNAGLACHSLYHYCYVPSTPTPTPKPIICTSPSSRCTNLSTINPAAEIDACSSDQTSWVFSYNCPAYQVCNSTHTACANTISGPTPTPICPEGQKKCLGGHYVVCFSGDWEMIAGTNPCPTPTPQVLSNTYDCPVVNGLPDCTQTNPLWANNPFPGGCFSESINKLYIASCGPATVCSLLCACKKTSDYCNLDNCLKTVTLFNLFSCNGVSLSHMRNVLSQYPECFQNKAVVPDTFVDQTTGANLSNPVISWSKIDQLLSKGKVQVYGKFGDITHISLIVGKDPTTGKRIYNDPYFNMQNTNSLYQINSSFLEDYLPINIYEANMIEPL